MATCASVVAWVGLVALPACEPRSREVPAPAPARVVRAAAVGNVDGLAEVALTADAGVAAAGDVVAASALNAAVHADRARVVVVADAAVGSRHGRAVEIALGGGHGCIRLEDGTVRCWGSNDEGQLGDGTTTARSTPTVVPGVSDVAQIALGGSHTCARIADGTVRCWGEGLALAFADAPSRRAPGAALDPPADQRTPQLVPGLTSVVQLALGSFHSCARMADGTVRCWGGEGASGGDGGARASEIPLAVRRLRGVVELVVGGAHACARLETGAVLCWGNNDEGQLGDGTTVARAAPVVVRGLADVAQLAAGSTHTCARTRAGGVVCWGGNSLGQLGDGTTLERRVPTPVAGLADVADVAAGFGTQTCARMADGSVRCWGLDRTHSAPGVVAGLTEVAQVATGPERACVRLASGAVRCWGANVGGQLGDGSLRDRVAPTEVLW